MRASTHAIGSAATSAAVRTLSLPASVLLLLTAVVVPILTFLAAYAATGYFNSETFLHKGYFLSAAIDLPPASNFGSLGLTLTLAAWSAVAVIRHEIVDARLRALPASGGDASELHRLHRLSRAAALTAALGGMGVAAYPHNQNSVGHNGFAAMFVLTALLHFHLESLLERRAHLSSRVARGFRASIVHAATAGCATFLSHVAVEELAGVSIGIGKPAAAAAEICSCACFLGYLASYTRSFHETHVALTVTVPAALHRPYPAVETASVTANSSTAASSPLSSLLQLSPSLAPCRGLRRCRSAGALGAPASSSGSGFWS